MRFRLFLLALLATAPAMAEAAPLWEVDHAASRLSFVASQSGQPVEGVFQEWRAEIRFDPAAPGESSVSVEIETASLDSGSADRDATIRSGDLLAVERHPTARFEAAGFRDLGGGRYEAPGRLTLRGETRELALPFSLTLEGETALAEGAAEIDRLAFGVGQGQWRDTSLVPAAVAIRFTVKATRRD